MAIPAQKPGSSKQDYKTPLKFMLAIEKKLNIPYFDFDLACTLSSGEDNNCQSPNGGYTEEDNSLTKEWSDLKGWLWLNPPYKNIEPWITKAFGASLNGANIAVLVPASVGANWYKRAVHQKAFVLYLNGRLAFIPDKPKWLYPKDLMLVLYNGWAVGSDVWDWRK